MYFKFYEDGRRKAVDLNDLYLDQSLFIIAGSPALKKENLWLLDTRGVVTLAINNAAEFYKPDLWVGGDRPECYSERILKDPSITKFVNYGKRSKILDGKPWMYQPNTLFYGCHKNFTRENLLEPDRDLVWWKNTWWIALQLAYRLGFRTLYLLGAEFKISKEHQYAWSTNLRKNEVAANVRLYNKTVKQMIEMKPIFDKFRLRIINCCKTSSLLDTYGFMPLEDAVRDATKDMPKVMNTAALPHSLRKETK